MKENKKIEETQKKMVKMITDAALTLTHLKLTFRIP